MPKYIDKNNLPQFKYYNFCESSHNYWGIEPKPYAAYHIPSTEGDMSFVDDSVEELDINLAEKDLIAILGNNNNADELCLKWSNNIKNKKGQEHTLLQYLLVVLHAMFKDKYITEQWKHRLEEKLKIVVQDPSQRQMQTVLSLIDEYLTFSLVLRVCQGFPFIYKDDNKEIYPKMLLVEAEFYKKQRDGAVTLEYDTIKNALQDACYVITVNGESAERKIVFCLIDAGACAMLYMLDPNNGLTEFYVRSAKESGEQINWFNQQYGGELIGDTTIASDSMACHPRGDYWCAQTREEEYCLYCGGRHNCKHKSLNIAAAIIYCFQEYIKKIRNSTLKEAERKSGTKLGGGETEKYIPSDMIRMYDIKYSDDELKRFNKFIHFRGRRAEYPSTEKAPHVRRGCMRYNPKTGQKDIVVKGSIIHKDKYQGFVSAERLKE